MLEEKIISPRRYSTWVENSVSVRKMNSDIRICVKFNNLNELSLKDNDPLPNKGYLLQRTTRPWIISMLDGFSKYNQIKEVISSAPLFINIQRSFKFSKFLQKKQSQGYFYRIMCRDLSSPQHILIKA